MENIFPSAVGLKVTGVTYQYDTIKEIEDLFKVIIENKNAIDGGTLFTHTDDWSGLPGNRILRTVPADSIPQEYWGQGSVSTQGDGSIEDFSIRYSYKYDTCEIILSDPSCPGYALAFLDYLREQGLLGDNIDTDDAYWEDYLEDLMETETQEEEQVTEEPKEEEEEEESLEDALSIAGAAEELADTVAQQQMLQALTYTANMNSYYAANIPGGEYNETVSLPDAKIPDNRSAAVRFGLASEKLHNELVDLQYE